MEARLEARLSRMELHIASVVGVSRRNIAIQRGVQNRRVSEKGDWDIEVTGAIAELAFAKLMNLYWSATTDTFKLPDIGNIWQIRGTEYPNGCLIVKPNDRPQDRYALVTVEGRKVTLVGWIEGTEAKKEKYYREDFDSYWVSQDKLKKFDEEGTDDAGTQRGDNKSGDCNGSVPGADEDGPPGH